MSEWSNLPNAQHIDWVIASLSTHSKLWSATRDAAWDATDAAWGAAYNATRDAARDATRGATRYAAYSAARDATYEATYDAAYGVARNAILALVAYDDCDQYLSMHSEQLRAWTLMTEHPTAVLLLPMVVVREQIEQPVEA